MKKFSVLFVAILMFAATAFAQGEKLEPGIYSIIDSSATHLKYTPGIASNSGFNVVGIEVGDAKYKFKGATSGVKVTDRIRLVIDPQKKVIRKTPKVYEPFIKSMTPELLIIVPLDVVKDKRIYDEGTSVEGFRTKKHTRVEFEWELTDENTYDITADFEPGEYAVIFKPARLGAYDFCSIYGFYVEEK